MKGEGAARGMAPTWVARQLPSDVGRVKVGAELHLKATGDVSLGHRVLIASQDRKQLAGLGVVLGEPMKRKGKQYVRSVLVTHSFKRPRPALERPLGAKQGARPATDDELGLAREKAGEETPFSFVFKAAKQVARQLSPGDTSEKDSEALLVAMIEAAGYEGVVAHQVPIPGPSKPLVDKAPERLRADIVAYLGNRSRRAELLVIEGEWTHIGGAESAAQAYEYASRIIRAGSLAKGAKPFGLASSQVKRARVHPVVVANKLLRGCATADRLDVSMMNYFEFAELLRHKGFSRLKTAQVKTS